MLRKFPFVFLLFISFASIAQELPPINSYTAKDYKAENQNWAISQSKNKFIYVANNKGLLEFNGANWQLYSTPNKTIMRSVKVLKDKVYTGFYMDFGFWKKNEFSELEFTSIVEKQNIKMLDDEQIWEIIELDGWMLFKSLQRIYLYNLKTNEVKIINSEFKIHKLSKVKDVIYFQEANKGIFKIENGFPKLISDDKILKENIIVEIFKKEDRLLFLTQKSGFFNLVENKLVKWKIPSDTILKKLTVYSAKQLKNNDFALGTISDGFIYLNSNGEINYQITQSSGLNNNTLLSVFEDIDNNIWLGLDNGINSINNSSPFKIYNHKNDFIGTVYASIVHENNLYLGTNQGLFFRKKDSKAPFKLIKNTQGQVWSLAVFDGALFCGHDSGTFIIKNNLANLIFNKQGTWKFQKIDENKIIQGCYDGLYILQKKNNNWGLRNKIAGFNTSSKYFEKYNSHKFLVNHEYKGVFKLTLDKDFKKVLSKEIEESLDKGLHSCLISYQDKILYSSKAGVFLYDKNKDVFKKDIIYSQLISEDDFISAKLAFNKSNNVLWSFSKESIKCLIPGKLTTKPIVKSLPISAFMPKATYGYENIIHLENEKYLIGTSNGYITVDLNKIDKDLKFTIQINEINNFIIDGPKVKVNLLSQNNFLFKENNLEFYYSVPNYSKITSIKYQHLLLGQSKQWSVPSVTKSVLFENIPYGDYTFKVRALVDGKISSKEATYSFTIQRPWYLSNLLITIYVLLFLISFYLVHVASKRYYRKQREELLEKAKKELELRELESSQQIIKLNNDKLRNDIESKNRELATSTMNIIKKNDFLNTIKIELINGKEKNISKVVKIIDKNLNNTDDWKMFQEAFNNADKNFLKKVKDKHSGLTPNDLRLCAYLRLNLSSKEIAPLLNISPRSVEVKRYRLRKKMDLPHDANLTNYILEI
ncbi:LuxR C-terminal-related transcriptional regulator [uncultured Polaribacter sp.]|uniref:helix-turn-helix and ligand-binding sensor domain-containing protein n=1 Tax=uncultured Polaribacter sp. TaxID=174711 RepID=UPI0026359705|nr:LuxR C-terminal-related transcriptional regulator [uncultured Polaribacter sp.]